MKKGIIITIVSILAFGGLALFLYNSDKIEVEVEEIPFGLEWGMSMEEVQAAMKAQGYRHSKKAEALENNNIIYYHLYGINGYQGIKRANTEVRMFFTQNKLHSVYYSFRHSDEGDTISLKMIKKLGKALKKAYQEASLLVIDDSDEKWNFYMYIFEKSVISITGDDDFMSLLYADRDEYGDSVDEALEEAEILNQKVIKLPDF